MTKSTGAVLFQSCFFGLAGVIIAISLQDWRLCRYNRLYPGTFRWYTDCVRDSFFKYCYGVCTNQADYSYYRCRDIPWNVWGKKTGMYMCIYLVYQRFLCLLCIQSLFGRFTQSLFSNLISCENVRE